MTSLGSIGNLESGINPTSRRGSGARDSFELYRSRLKLLAHVNTVAKMQRVGLEVSLRSTFHFLVPKTAY